MNEYEYNNLESEPESLGWFFQEKKRVYNFDANKMVVPCRRFVFEIH